ncbi:MAG: Trk system potassium transporter TrkA [Porticoccus sp.]|jgi:trk system potassium uptake protein TrkA|nr:Trk system potassium transporter TrkA [Porticoccus sp.]
MKIIIVGAGRVGTTLAQHLSAESNDISVIDWNEKKLVKLQERIDIRVVCGMGSHPNILIKAGIEDANMLVAVTKSDELNIVTCQVAHSLFRTETKIARVRSASYTEKNYRDKLFNEKNFPVDFIISPEKVVTDYICRLIKRPGALQVVDYAHGLAQLVAVKVAQGGPLIGKELKVLREHMPKADARVAAIFRRDRPIIPEGNTLIEEDDEVFFIAAKKNIRKVMEELGRLDNPYRRIIIAGGGNIGYQVARSLEEKLNLKIIEYSEKRCEFISEHLNNTLVLHGSATDQDILVQENINKTDVFMALTNDDEVNIMSSLLAKRLGVRTVMTLINNPVYANLIQGGEIDIAISPQQATTSTLLAHVRRGDTVSANSLRRGAAEAMEIIVHGDQKSSKVVNRTISEIKAPKGVTIAAIVRDEEVIIAHHDIVIRTNDHVVIFVVDKEKTREVERLFSVGLNFF